MNAILLRQLDGATRCIRTSSLPYKFIISDIHFEFRNGFSRERNVSAMMRTTASKARKTLTSLMTIERTLEESKDSIEMRCC